MSDTATPENPGLLNWVLLLLLGVIWGSAFMSMTIALDGFGPRMLAASRVLFAALALNILGAMIGQPITAIRKLDGRRAWTIIFAIGAIALAMPMLMLTWGQQHVPSAFAGVAMGAVPLLVLPLVYIFSPEEGIGPRRIIGMIVGFIGLAVLIGPSAFSGTGSDLAFWGRLACICAACGYAIGSVLTRRAPKMPPIALASGTMTAAALIIVPFALLTEEFPTDFTIRPSIALLYAALLPTALGAIIRVRVITTAGSLFMNITSYMVPVWSVIFGITLMGESLPAQLYTALALILLGSFISQSRAIMAAVKRA
ncbi:EamA family transporter [Planktotalea sp.]|uniref:DMT family transporter n=1 Tax=Planktotalea sp. TaxID=2029877 RepID=UPI0025D11FEF|nr:EamA family transporter [Planktotalea sp.]